MSEIQGHNIRVVHAGSYGGEASESTRRFEFREEIGLKIRDATL